MDKYVKSAGLEKAAHGIYISSGCLTNEMYLLQAQFPKAVYSHEAALYLHNFAEKEPLIFLFHSLQDGMKWYHF